MKNRKASRGLKAWSLPPATPLTGVILRNITYPFCENVFGALTKNCLMLSQLRLELEYLSLWIGWKIGRYFREY